MMFDRVHAKYEAKRIIREARPSPILVTLIYLLLTTGVSQIVEYFLSNPFSEAVALIMQGYDPMEVYPYVFGGGGAVMAIFVSVLLGLYGTIMAFGYNGYTLRLARGQEGGYYDLFDGFSLVMKIILLQVLISLFIFLWSLLFMIPGVIASFSYSQAVYCLLDEPDISPLEAIRRSKMMMRGQKFNLFILQLSFFGWVLAGSALATVIGRILWSELGDLAAFLFNLWLCPYQGIVISRFYSELDGWFRGQNEYRGPRVEF